VEQSEKIALVGPNGAGKSTLLRIMASTEPIDSGQLVLGHNVQLDYFAQDQDKVLDDSKTVLDTLMSAAPLELVPQLRTLLGSFLFRGDEVFKKVAVLSGGERNRLALAKMLLQPANFLLLDEPTNHLDMDAKEVLLEALQNFHGTTVFVSHDRYFIDALATKIIEVGQGGICLYPGNYEDYLWKKQQEDPAAVAGIIMASELRSSRQWQAGLRGFSKGCSSLPPQSDTQQPVIPLTEPTVKSKPARINPQKLNALIAKIESLEFCIAELETRISAWEKQMADADFFKNQDNAQTSLAAWQQAQEELKEKMHEWETLTLERERVTASG
jgi:ATP-binding cassette subfamily F protein 3